MNQIKAIKFYHDIADTVYIQQGATARVTQIFTINRTRTLSEYQQMPPLLPRKAQAG
jgi:hypothetical protein